jgi:hypothetical protein
MTILKNCLIRIVSSETIAVPEAAHGDPGTVMPMQPKREFAADSLQIAQWTKIDAIIGCG